MVNLAIVPFLLLASQDAAPANGGAQDAEMLRGKALREYQAGRFASACELFQKLVKSLPSDGAAWADLGVCRMRQGRRKEAVHASLMAVRHGDKQTRLNAYFNLGRLGENQDLPRWGPEDECMSVATPPELECSRAMKLCRHSEYNGGNGGGETEFFVLAWPEPDAYQKVPQLEAWMRVPTFRSRWQSTKACDPAWGYRPSVQDELEARCWARLGDVERCTHAADIVLSEVTAIAPNDNIPGLSDQERNAVGITQAEATKVVAERESCLRGLDNGEQAWRRCSIVTVDACRGLLGIVCIDEENGDSGDGARAKRMARELSAEKLE